jgi:hypothetical protein
MLRTAQFSRSLALTTLSVFLLAGCSDEGADASNITEDIGVLEDAGSTSDGLADGSDATPQDGTTEPEVTDTSETPPSFCEDAGEGAGCDDGNACTTDDTCASGVCTGATNVVCSADTCENATCDPAVGCVITYEPNGSECTVGCFDTASCQDGGCEVDPESAVACPASESECVSELGCDPATGECTVVIPMPASVSCDLDENVCSLDSCDGDGQCVATGEMNACDAQNNQSPCWTWGCNGKAGCVQISFVEGVSCNDNNPCTYSDICTVSDLSQELCQGEPLPIDDQNPCTDDACIDGVVSHTPIDGLSCPIEGCDLPGLCTSGACEAPQACLCDPIDGGWSEYTWGDCSNPCGEGTRVGTRTCTDPVPSCGGLQCDGDDSVEDECVGESPCGEFEVCTDAQCVASCEPINGGWSPWSEGACSAQCGEGVSVHTRTCDSPPSSCGGADCQGENTEMVSCDGETVCGAFETCADGQCVASCDPVNGGWSPWSAGPCSVQCGVGLSVHTRTCDSPPSSCGGADCQGENAEEVSCNGETQCGAFETCEDGQCEASCSPTDGGWSDWTWQACPVACGPSEQLGTRTCDSPSPGCGGAECQGDASMFTPCNGVGCGEFEACESGQCQSTCDPVNGGWTDYTWSACNAECGGGTKTGNRFCAAPTPECGGALCVGDDQLVESCNSQECINYLTNGVNIYSTGAQVVTGVVPDGVTTIHVSAWGAGGGGGFPGNGGGGAYVSANVSVNPGDEVEIRVASAGVKHGGGGGASYLFVNGQAAVIAAGGGGAGSDGCSGCEQGIGSAANGGGGGSVGGTAQAGTGNTKYSTGSGGGGGASAGGPGAAGVSSDASIYSGCAENGAPGSSHAGGGGHGANSCVPGNNGASYHLGGAQSYGNGGGGGGGGGLYGGGGGAGKYTYTGGGGGGGSSWTSAITSSVSSEAASYQNVGGSGGAYYQAGHGRGGDAGDYTNWPNNMTNPTAGAAGLVVLAL